MTPYEPYKDPLKQKTNKQQNKTNMGTFANNENQDAAFAKTKSTPSNPIRLAQENMIHYYMRCL